jgi:Amt family ammonium transporter
VTFVLLRVIGLFMKLREPDAVLLAGDIMLHGEVAYPEEEPDAELPSGDIPGEPVPELHHQNSQMTLTDERAP